MLQSAVGRGDTYRPIPGDRPRSRSRDACCPTPERPLCLLNPPQGLPLPFAVPLSPKRSLGIVDAVPLRVGLDLLHAAIAGFALGPIARPLAKLVLDVGRWCDAGGGDRQLAALGEDAFGDLQQPWIDGSS